jgi:hypothetical protein
MKTQKLTTFLIKFPYIVGIGADALWAVGLFFPAVYRILVGAPGFSPDFQVSQIMRIGGILMTGWTILLLWALKNPIDRRFIIILTAFPVIFGLLLVSIGNLVNGNTYCIWILVKTTILLISTLISYYLAGKKEVILG